MKLDPRPLRTRHPKLPRQIAAPLDRARFPSRPGQPTVQPLQISRLEAHVVQRRHAHRLRLPVRPEDLDKIPLAHPQIKPDHLPTPREIKDVPRTQLLVEFPRRREIIRLQAHVRDPFNLHPPTLPSPGPHFTIENPKSKI